MFGPKCFSIKSNSIQAILGHRPENVVNSKITINNIKQPPLIERNRFEVCCLYIAIKSGDILGKSL